MKNSFAAKIIKRGLIVAALFLLFCVGIAEASFALNKIDPVSLILDVAEIKSNQTQVDQAKAAGKKLPAITASPRLVKVEEEKRRAEESLVKAAPPSKEVKKKIAAAPPVNENSSGVSGQTTTNRDGTTTTVVSEGSVNSAEFNRIAALPNTPDTPFAVKFNDETGRYAMLEAALKDYLNSTLRWSNEISVLKEIDIKFAGATGWSGQYSGSYDINQSGDITDAFGWITLNASAYDSYKQQHPTDAIGAEDFFKFILAHEYGHHYTLYHKWVDADLPLGTRFPNNYYATRPLSESDTVVDCTAANWSKCEPEIIAEDYSYIYSGYGLHAMQASVGLPSSAMKLWFDNISVSLKSNQTVAATPVIQPNFPPDIKITSPSATDLSSSRFTFSVEATDDKSIDKVVFYRDDTVLQEDESAPYEIEVDLIGLVQGSYKFRAKAFDSDGAADEAFFTLTINQSPPKPDLSPSPVQNNISDDSPDTVKPAAAFVKPAVPVSEWTESDLLIQISGSDNRAVTKIELYINDVLAASENSNQLSRRWSYFEGLGTYVLKAKVYDAAGNTGETSATVNKQ